jgi:cyclopropane fatty-acyl-phospholipid synthase-like methyltransferase
MKNQKRDASSRHSHRPHSRSSGGSNVAASLAGKQPFAVDFGTYHHSTPEQSNDIRERAEKAFSKVLRALYPSGAPLRILDAGCGLGFLTYVAAKCFPKARVTGVDVFRHSSISGISLENAADNMRILGIDSRTLFLKHDLTEPLESDRRYDLAVSNLVFHNMGKSRFKAYETVFDLLKRRGHFVIGDLFRRDEADMDYFRERATLVSELDALGSGPAAYKIRVLRKA